MPIQKLSQLLINQIAAGEVIERPASVVKELVENSIDAGATRIDVQIEDGGKELIRIADNGCGIPFDELPLAFEAHATSKICTSEDLNHIITMGFRGEALASIVSISHMKITSREPDSESGGVIEGSGDDITDPKPVGCSPGTVMEVRNLFFNTPARRKFMRTSTTEFSHINDMMTRIALAHPHVGFKLTHKGRKTIDVPPDQTYTQRGLELIGKGIEDAFLEFDADERGVKVWGLAALPSMAKATAKYQYVFVNDRPIKDKSISHAMKEAYRGLIEPAQQPMVLLFVQVDPETIDVNVHPTKAEIRFAQGNAIHGQVLGTIRRQLLASDLTPNVKLDGRVTESKSPDSDQSLTSPREMTSGEPLSSPSNPLTHSDSVPPGPMPPGPVPTPNRPTPLPPMGGTFTSDRPMPPMSSGSSGGSSARGADHQGFRDPPHVQRGFDFDQVVSQIQADVSPSPSDETPPDFVPPEARSESTSQSQSSMEPQLTGPIQRNSQDILQVHNSYLISQDDEGVLIIDQHALHERVMFQTLYERIYAKGQLESQRLITPITIDADDRRIEVLEQLTPLLEKIGIEASAIGPTSIGIHAFPTLLFDRGVDPIPFMDELLQKGEQWQVNDEEALHEVLDMMSCKAAVKAGEAMSQDELLHLLRQREKVERSSNCPHGRPTAIRLSMFELEKLFKRR